MRHTAYIVVQFQIISIMRFTNFLTSNIEKGGFPLHSSAFDDLLSGISLRPQDTHPFKY